MLRRANFLVSIATVALLTIAANVPAFAGNGSVTYTYDALGRVTSATYDTGVTIIYTYDANGNVTSQSVSINGG